MKSLKNNGGIKDDDPDYVISNLFFKTFLAIMILGGIAMILGALSDNCEGDVKGSLDSYYFKSYTSNLTGSGYKCLIGNRTQDKINAEKRAIIVENNYKFLEERKECYMDGEDYNLTFDLINDYDLSCQKIKYYNDHFILSSEKRDAGSVVADYNGFFSSHHVKVKMYDWVNTEYVATERLVKKVNYHLDCNNETLSYNLKRDYIDGSYIYEYKNISLIDKQKLFEDTTDIRFYTEQDFIVYYANNCIN